MAHEIIGNSLVSPRIGTYRGLRAAHRVVHCLWKGASDDDDRARPQGEGPRSEGRSTRSAPRACGGDTPAYHAAVRGREVEALTASQPTLLVPETRSWGHAAFLYSLMSPSQRGKRMTSAVGTRSSSVAGSGDSGCCSSARCGRCVL